MTELVLSIRTAPPGMRLRFRRRVFLESIVVKLKRVVGMIISFAQIGVPVVRYVEIMVCGKISSVGKLSSCGYSVGMGTLTFNQDFTGSIPVRSAFKI